MTDPSPRIDRLSAAQRAEFERRLAALIDRRGDGGTGIEPRDRDVPSPLTLSQRREWAVERLRGSNNISAVFRIEGDLDLELLDQVVLALVDRNDSLRSTIELDGDSVLTQRAHPVTRAPVTRHDLTDIDPAEQRQRVLDICRAGALRRFAPTETPRLRVEVLTLDQHTHVALFAADHAACDAWSMGVVVQQVIGLYAAPDGAAETAPLQFADFAAWQDDRLTPERTEQEIAHWCETLRGFTPTALPSDRPYPARPTFVGDMHPVTLDRATVARLEDLCVRERTSMFSALLSACAVLMQRHLHTGDQVVGSLLSGRTTPEAEDMIGCFVNPVPLRMAVGDDDPLATVLRTAASTYLTAHDHQEVPLEKVIDRLGLGRIESQTSLSHLWINVLTLPEAELALPGLRIAPEPVDYPRASVDLTLTYVPQSDGGAQLQWEYMTEVFDESTVRLLAAQHLAVLEALVADLATTVGEVVLDAMAEPVREPAPEPAGTDRNGTVVDLIEGMARRHGDLPAVTSDGDVITHAELDRRSRALAAHLRTLGAGPGHVVAVMSGRSPGLAVGLYGVLRSGAAFLGLDPDYPAERLEYMVQDSGATVVVIADPDHDADARRAVGTVPVVDLAEVPVPDEGELLPLPQGTDAAYVMYTSGSTGRPKGAVVEHAALAVYAQEVAERLELAPQDRFMQFASASFDVLIEEVVPIWTVGGSVSISAAHVITGREDLVSVLAREEVTVVELPTAYWHSWVRDLDRLDHTLPPSLRTVIIGGERVIAARLARWTRHGVALEHVYGLTETTVSSTFHRFDPRAALPPGYNLPIGLPLPSTEVHVLDHRLRPVPRGGVGEAFLGGPVLARGYLGKPGLTAERFVADPDPRHPRGRLYRTGDVVRVRADGALEFHTRVDTQLSIRGFRIEPAEVEEALVRQPGVAAAVATMYEPHEGDRRLVAYVVAEAADLDPVALRRALVETLPTHLVPSAIIPVDALPVGPNGKLDRSALPSPEGGRATVAVDFVAPRTAEEQLLSTVIGAVLGQERVGMDDDFFELGGDSILAIQVVARAQEAGLQIEPFDLFERPTIAALAVVAEAGGRLDADQGEVSGPVTLVDQQLAYCRGGGRGVGAHLGVVLTPASPVQPATLRRAVAELVRHHDGLRQRFLLAGEHSRARVAPVDDGDLVAVLEGARDASCGDPGVADRVLEVAEGLDVGVGPAVRVALAPRSDGPARVVLVAHRLVADEESLQILAADLDLLVRRSESGDGSTLPAKTTSWPAWTRRLAQAADPRDEALADHVEPPTDMPWGAGSPADGRPWAERVQSVVDPSVTDRLTGGVPAATGCSPEDLVLLALADALSRWSGYALHRVRVEGRGRPDLYDDADVSRTVGWFARHTTITLEPPEDFTVAAARAVAARRTAVPHDGVGTDAVGPSASGLRVALSRETPPGPRLGPAQRVVLPADEHGEPVELRVVVGTGTLECVWSVDTTRADRARVEALAAELADALGRVAGIKQSAESFPLAGMSEDQLAALLGRL